MPERRNTPDEDFDTEKSQAVVRIIIVGVAILYSAAQVQIGAAAPYQTGVFYFILQYLVFSLIVERWISVRPGENVPRRLITITADIGGLTYVMSVGDATFTPLYSILIWVTVGNGLRFGVAYLKISTLASLVSIAVTTIFNAYWRQNPFMVMTLVSTTVLVPAYIHSLLEHLRRAYARAQEASLSKSRFLAQASHDLRQPIHAISLFTACLRDARLGAEELRMVENIDRSLQSVSRLFKSLLDISTLDSGRVEPSREPVAIDDILKDVWRQNADAAQLCGTELRSLACDAVVTTDRALFTTMLQNIVSNAIKYAPGRPILIGCRRGGGRLAVQVYDRGPGIATEHQAKVFEEFYQVRRRGDRDIDGVGLGLPIVRRLGDLLDVAVDLRSVPGRGTCVTLGNLPIARVPRPAADRPAHEPTATISGLRVLLVEDDEAVLLATANLLRRWGCRVQAEPAIPEAVADFDLLITDFDLGNGVTGTDCIAAVRTRAGRDVPTVVMSGYDEARVREDLGSPDVTILSKPVRTAELRSVILAARTGRRPPAASV